MTIITLLTDFGTADGYVAEMKGELVTRAPGVTVMDLSHDLPAHDIEAGRLAVARYWRRFPRGTVHLVVVDPGVGSSRAALAVHADGRWLLGPDNGILSPALFALDARAVALEIPATAAPTFHGRDVFAPAAAQLACGVPLESLGSPHATPVRRRTPEPVLRPDGWLDGQVLTIDRFGNVVTNLMAHAIDAVAIGERVLPVVRTYADLAVGEVGALPGSTGLLELASSAARACDLLGIVRGSPIRARRRSTT